MKCKVILFTLSLALLILSGPLPAKGLGAGIVISEVQLQCQTAPGDEFIELYNNTALPITLDGWRVEYLTESTKTTTSLVSLAGQLPARSFMVLGKTNYYPEAAFTFTKDLSNTGGHLRVVAADEEEADRLAWGGAIAPEQSAVSIPAAGFTLQRKPGAAGVLQDTNNNQDDFIVTLPATQGAHPSIAIPEPPENPPAAEPPACSGVEVSEIMANPAGADTNGGEFIELYNPQAEEVALQSCQLKTDKMSSYAFSSGATIPPHGYFVVKLADKLLNGGGMVTLLMGAEEEEISYPALKDGEAWAFIAPVWQVTAHPTPGSYNILAAVLSEEDNTAAAAADEQTACPQGKFRNPATNRCKSIVSGTELAACLSGQVRNTATNRCRKLAPTAAALKSCAPGQERNPATNRCRKIANATQTSKPCAPGQERNAETNRCRKIAAAMGSSDNSESQGDGLGGKFGIGAFVLVLLGVISYAVYEYRTDIRNAFYKVRSRVAPAFVKQNRPKRS